MKHSLNMEFDDNGFNLNKTEFIKQILLTIYLSILIFYWTPVCLYIPRELYSFNHITWSEPNFPYFCADHNFLYSNPEKLLLLVVFSLQSFVICFIFS